jgi:hypothetical protein
MLSLLIHIDFECLVRPIAQRQDFLIFGIVVPALGRGLVGEPNHDANLAAMLCEIVRAVC